MAQASKTAKERKSGFRKVTISVSPGMYERLINESARRKIAGEGDHLFSAMLRQAVDRYLEHIEKRS